MIHNVQLYSIPYIAQMKFSNARYFFAHTKYVDTQVIIPNHSQSQLWCKWPMFHTKLPSSEQTRQPSSPSTSPLSILVYYINRYHPWLLYRSLISSIPMNPLFLVHLAPTYSVTIFHYCGFTFQDWFLSSYVQFHATDNYTSEVGILHSIWSHTFIQLINFITMTVHGIPITTWIL